MGVCYSLNMTPVFRLGPVFLPVKPGVKINAAYSEPPPRPRFTCIPGAPGSTPVSRIAMSTPRPSYSGKRVRKEAAPVSFLGSSPWNGNGSSEEWAAIAEHRRNENTSESATDRSCTSVRETSCVLKGDATLTFTTNNQWLTFIYNTCTQ